MTAELRALCAEWRALLEEDPPIAQQIVRRMLVDRLAVQRTAEGIRLTGMATFGPLMASIVLRGEMVPPGRNARQANTPLPRRTATALLRSLGAVAFAGVA